jgi:hypothetical protein
MPNNGIEGYDTKPPRLMPSISRLAVRLRRRYLTYASSLQTQGISIFLLLK